MPGVFEARFAAIVRKTGSVVASLGNLAEEISASLVQDAAYDGAKTMAASETFTIWEQVGAEKVGFFAVKVSGGAQIRLTMADDASAVSDQVFTLDLCPGGLHCQTKGTGKLTGGQTATITKIELVNPSSEDTVDANWIVAL